MENKAIVMYHNHCTDGFGAAYAAWLSLGDGADYIPMSYGYINKGETKNYLPEARIKGAIVFILDFSVPLDYLAYLQKHAVKVVWLDHHEDSFNLLGLEKNAKDQPPYNELKDNLYILLDNNRSGALLAWNYFHPFEEAPQLFLWIDDRDRWVFEMAGSKGFHAGLEAMKPWSFRQWLEMDSYEVRHKGDILLDMKAVHYDAIIGASKQEIWMPTEAGTTSELTVLVKGLVANAPPFYASEIGNMLAKESGTFGMTWYMNRDKRLGVSFRSLDGKTAKQLANVQGGGGHGNAAGCSMPISKLMEYLG